MPKRKPPDSNRILNRVDKILDSIAAASQDKLIECAIKCLENNKQYRTHQLFQDKIVKYLRLRLGQEKNEVFAVLFLDNENRALAFEKLFYGTINSTTVHPRGIVQRALFYNAGAVILAHNHPHGSVEPSAADQYVTAQLKHLLNLIDVKVLDHIIVSAEAFFSMVDHKML